MQERKTIQTVFVHSSPKQYWKVGIRKSEDVSKYWKVE